MQNSSIVKVYTEIVSDRVPERNIGDLSAVFIPARMDTTTNLKIGICISGSGVLHSDSGEKDFREDSIMILMPNERYKLLTYNTHTKWICLSIDIYKLIGESLLVNINNVYRLLQEVPTRTIIISDSKYDYIKETVRKIIKEGSDKYIDRTDIIAVNICELFLELRRIKAELYDLIDEDLIIPEALKPAFDFIENQYNKQISIEELASMCYLSPAGFRRKFYEAVAESPKTYLTKVRIKMAKLLLEKTDMPIVEIASHVGYANVSPFGRSFKLIAGCSPKAYRDKFSSTKKKEPFPIMYSNADSSSKLRIGAWYAIDARYLNQEFIRDIARAGINLVFVGYDYSIERDFILKYCYLYGIECILIDNRLFKDDKVRIDDYMLSSAFIGNTIVESPNFNDFYFIKKNIESYSNKLPDKIPFSLLFPMYASEKQLGTNDYRKYVNTFASQCAAKVLCVNIYPCYIGLDYKKLTYKEYLENLSIVSDACRQNNLQMWIIIQSMSFHESVRIPDETDLRWQLYCCLSFGATSVSHFSYCMPQRKPEAIDVFSGAMISHKGEKTKTWYNAREVNYEAHRLSNIYMQYCNLGAFLINEDPDLTYMHFTNHYTNFNYIKEISCNAPLLVGCFLEKDNRGAAFTLVNMTDLWKNESITVSFKTITCKKVCVYKNGYAFEVKKQPYTIELSCGEGIFVTLEF